ncbi:hypothetical protein CORC01_10135 [Colletotrichum orchidophilum]|uniref:Uncharacterized protein n=1 Tax=Colletotrichum orchidophilum TaxID=1209926 RepID=A0A1G4AZP1_9PEZI|nr:uncharacterized protein CORC01_10135 [Colletotrichum orchidophilum]OHE94607.1 hypothetical protein CORC01_10135 [Colletotrichum orchidophilum]
MPAITKAENGPGGLWKHHSSYESSGFLTERRQVEEPSGPLPPVSPAPPNSEVPCSGWGCLSEAQQAGVLVTIVVVFLSLFLGLLFFLRSKKKQENWIDGDLVLVRQRRRPRARSQATSINSKGPRFFFRHEGLTGTQQPHQLMITHPTILHIPPPPPLPVPVPLPMPMPLPVPFQQPQPIYPYPMAYQTHQYPSMQTQAPGHHQGHSAMSGSPINVQHQQRPQPYSQAQKRAHHRWSQMPDHQQTQQRSQQPSRRRPSLTRRLFSLFNNPVGRASTIASSESDSTRAPSIRSSHHSRTSATSIITPPSPEARTKKNATDGTNATRQNEVSPAVATVQSDDYVATATLRNGSPERHKPDSVLSAPANLSSKVHHEARGKATTTESPMKKRDNVESDIAKMYPISIPVCQVAESIGTSHSLPNVKPLKSALKNGNKPIIGARGGNVSNDQKLSTKADTRRDQREKFVDKRSPKETAHEVRHNHPDVMELKDFGELHEAESQYFSKLVLTGLEILRLLLRCYGEQ